MPFPNRRVNSQIASSTRTVSYSGGLNERFSSLEKKKSAQSNGNQFGNTGSGNVGRGTVFSRLRGGKTALAKGRANAIQNRLGKTVSGGIKKKGTTSAVGKKINNGRNRINKRATASKAAASKKSSRKVNKKPLTAEDLDKQMDAYMMKDKKTAQAKLDEELNSYMADAPALESENL